MNDKKNRQKHDIEYFDENHVADGRIRPEMYKT